MVWAGILDGHIIGPYFFPDNVTTQSYLDMLQDWLLPQLTFLGISPLDIIFQQDGAPAHYALVVRTWLDVNFKSWIGRGSDTMQWPPRSPDITPLDFFLWGYIKNIVYRDQPVSMQNLRDKITDAFGTVTADMLQNVQRNIVKRTQKCLDHNGEHFEQFM